MRRTPSMRRRARMRRLDGRACFCSVVAARLCHGVLLRRLRAARAGGRGSASVGSAGAGPPEPLAGRPLGGSVGPPSGQPARLPGRTGRPARPGRPSRPGELPGSLPAGLPALQAFGPGGRPGGRFLSTGRPAPRPACPTASGCSPASQPGAGPAGAAGLANLPAPAGPAGPAGPPAQPAGPSVGPRRPAGSPTHRTAGPGCLPARPPAHEQGPSAAGGAAHRVRGTGGRRGGHAYNLAEDRDADEADFAESA